jgi:hypothetical protein
MAWLPGLEHFSDGVGHRRRGELAFSLIAMHVDLSKGYNGVMA